MKRNKLLGIIGGLSIAVAGVAAVVCCASNNDVEVKAASTDKWSMIGTPNWDTDTALSYNENNKFYGNSENGRFELTYTFAQNNEFKFRKDNKWDISIGYGGCTGQGIDTYLTKSGENFKLRYSGTYVLSLKEDVDTYGDKSYGFAIAKTYNVKIKDGEQTIETTYFEDYDNSGFKFDLTHYIRNGKRCLGLYKESTFTTQVNADGGYYEQTGTLYAKYGSDTDDHYVLPSEMKSTSSTFRLWFRGNCDDWYAANAVSGLRAWGSAEFGQASGYVYVAPSIKNSKDNNYYWYADVPTDITGYQFVRLNPSDYSIWNYVHEQSSVTSEHALSVHYINSLTSGGLSFGTPSSMDAQLVAKALEGFYTCSDSTINGYGAIDLFTSKWYEKMDGDQVKSFADLTVLDYGTGGGSSKTAEVNAQEKYDEMVYLSNLGNSSRFNLFGIESSNNSVTWIIIVVSLAGLTAIGGFFFYKKRKEN